MNYKINPKYTKRLQQINQFLIESLRDEQNFYIKDFTKNYLNQSGKQLRPLLTLILAENFACEQSYVDKLAIIYEKIHIASLIHDDIIDHCSKRRYQKSLNAQLGDEVAILLGDYVFASTFYDATSYDKEFVRQTAKTISQLVKGELLQQQKTTLGDLDSYFEIISYKTSALLELVIGQTLRLLADKELLPNALKFANAFGKIFQIVDDWGDFCGIWKGKNTQNDIKNGLATLPIILLYQASDTKQKEKLCQIWQNKDNSSNNYIEKLAQQYQLPKLVEKEVFKLYSSTQESLFSLSGKIDVGPLQYLVDSHVRKLAKK